MGYPSHPLADLVIPVGTKPSNAIAKAKFRTARALSILSGNAAFDGTIVVQGKGVDGTWRAVQVAEADLNVTVDDATLVDYPGRFEEIRLNSSSNETPAQTFECQAIYKVG